MMFLTGVGKKMLSPLALFGAWCAIAPSKRPRKPARPAAAAWREAG